MKIKSKKIIDRKGKILEHKVYHFNSNGLIERKEYLNSNEEIEFYATFKFDKSGNWIEKKEYDSNGILQVSFEREFDSQNREIKFVELTAENKIWLWQEKQFPNDNTVIYLSKNEYGEIDHKTVENTKTGEQKRYKNGTEPYTTIEQKFDAKNRPTIRKTIDKNGIVIEENQYSYDNGTEFWKLFVDGKFIKTEERNYDKNGNLEFYVRRNNNGRSLEWLEKKYDEFGNAISIENGIELGKPTNKRLIEIEYYE